VMTIFSPGVSNCDQEILRFAQDDMVILGVMGVKKWRFEEQLLFLRLTCIFEWPLLHPLYKPTTYCHPSSAGWRTRDLLITFADAVRIIIPSGLLSLLMEPLRTCA